MNGGGIPELDLLDATHAFPCPYLLKVIGRTENGFAARVVAAVRDELSSAVDPPFRVRHTAGGRHVCITLEPLVQTSWQVLALYRRIRGMTGLILLL
jgi:uncharacterized protein